MTDRMDLLLFGATGFTGKHCISYIHRMSKSDGRNLTWGVAGRSEQKLKETLEKMGKKLDADLSKIPVVTANIDDNESLLKMALRAKVVINCCGPYQILGKAVVEACVAAGTHHVDVSGEPQYMERMQLEQNEAAKEKGIYIISACGFDSIPTDLGIVYLQQKFDGVLNSVVTYLELWEEGGNSSGAGLNYGTWESVVHGLANWGELKEIRKKLFPTKLPTFKPKLKMNSRPHKSDIVDGWVLPFPGSDRSVARRSQRYFYEKESKRPIQVETYFVLQSLLHVILLAIFGFIFSILIKFESGRKMLLSYPGIFSCGLFSKDPPTEEKIEKSWFQLTFYGEGWNEKLEEPGDQYTIPCNKSIVGRVKGRNPGYGATCACLVGAAVIVATESKKMPETGGVFTPGVAFANTSLINLLVDNDVTFDIISEKDI